MTTFRSKRFRRFMSLVLVASTGSLWLLLGNLGCRHDSQTATRPSRATAQPTDWQPRSQEGFVGSAACGRCHEAIAEQYRSHPMAAAMAAADQLAGAPEHQVDPKIFSEPSFLEYEVEVTADGIVHHERLIAADGSTLVEQAEPIVFAMGSGTRGRSYLLERDGQLFMSPISWYSSEEKWDLSPGYRPVDHPQFGRPVADRCLRCHCGQPTEWVGGTTEVPTYAPPFVREVGISCERCHGPGADHIEFHENGLATSNAARDPIVNPVHLQPERRDDVCNQCHLQGKVEVLRAGRLPSDFRPGDLIGDIWTVFVDGANVKSDQSTKAVSHVQQMQMSRCYIESQQALGCVSCHDPHGMSSPAERIVEVKAACLQCHASNDCGESLTVRQATNPSDNCVECHMPRLSAHDVPHTTQTDHRLLKNPGQAPTETPTSSPSDDSAPDWAVYGENLVELNKVEFERAIGIAMLRDAERSGNQALFQLARERLEPLVETFADDPPLLEALALAYYRLELAPQALETWQKVLELDPQHEESLLNLGTYYQNKGQLGLAEQFLGRYVELRPFNVDGLVRLSLVQGQLLKIEEAIELAKRAIALNPRHWEAYRWLIELYRDSGQSDQGAPLQKILDQVSAEKLRQ